MLSSCGHWRYSPPIDGASTAASQALLSQLTAAVTAIPSQTAQGASRDADPGDWAGRVDAGSMDRAVGGSEVASLQCRWQVKLEGCVDASPVLLIQPRLPGPSAGQQGEAGAAAASAQASKDGAEVHWWAFACSHGGEVVCADGGCGEAVWRAQLPGRADAGLAVTADLKVTPRMLCCQTPMTETHGEGRKRGRLLLPSMT